MSYGNVRLSCQKISGTGGNGVKKDWSNQSVETAARIKSYNRKKFLRDQVVFPIGRMPLTGQKVTGIHMIRVNGPKGDYEVAVGEWNGRKVQRDGYAYDFVKAGKAPGRWMVQEEAA